MQIPNQLNPYDQKTLLIISAHDIARSFLINDRDVEKLDVIHTEDTEYNYSDKEGFTYSSNVEGKGSGSVPGFEEKNRQHYEKVFANHLAKKLTDLDTKLTPQVILLTVPDQLKNIIANKLSGELKKKLEIVTGNYINMPLPDVLEAIEEESIPGLYREPLG